MGVKHSLPKNTRINSQDPPRKIQNRETISTVIKRYETIKAQKTKSSTDEIVDIICNTDWEKTKSTNLRKIHPSRPSSTQTVAPVVAVAVDPSAPLLPSVLFVDNVQVYSELHCDETKKNEK